MSLIKFTLRDKIVYNQATSQKFGWTPQMFGASNFDEELINKIEQFQKDNRLDIDGLCGEFTYKKLHTEYEAKVELAKHQLQNKVCVQETKKENYIDVGWKDKKVKIEWDKFVGLTDVGNLSLPSLTYKTVNYERKPNLMVLHHDACLSSKSCHDVLLRRGLSVQFCICNDGTIYQLTPLNVSAQHAGFVNMQSVGVEVSNAVELKYQGHYKIKGFGERPIIKQFHCHNKNYGDVLGLYSIQKEALRVLVKTICEYYSIPLECPLDKDGNLLMDVSKDVQDKKYKGCVMHWHIDQKKWDCSGLDLVNMLKEIKEGK
jgi:hypothetical protein